jgi:uncharacterized DUF497 family protein
MSDETVYDFEWDATKARSNERKHDVTFEAAASVFLDPLALTVYDKASSHDEERWFTLGFDAKGALGGGAYIPGDRKCRRPDSNYLCA